MENSTNKRKLKRNLSNWILDFDKKFLESKELKGENKEIIYSIYNKTSELRKNFHNDYLPAIYHNLDGHSSRDFYRYEYFFRNIGFPHFGLSNNYNYNKEIKLLKTNYSTTNLLSKNSYSQTNKVNNLNIYQTKNAPIMAHEKIIEISKNNEIQIINDTDEFQKAIRVI